MYIQTNFNVKGLRPAWSQSFFHLSCPQVSPEHHRAKHQSSRCSSFLQSFSASLPCPSVHASLHHHWPITCSHPSTVFEEGKHPTRPNVEFQCTTWRRHHSSLFNSTQVADVIDSYQASIETYFMNAFSCRNSCGSKSKCCKTSVMWYPNIQSLVAHVGTSTIGYVWNVSMMTEKMKHHSPSLHGRVSTCVSYIKGKRRGMNGNV